MARQSRANPATLEGANSSPLVGRSGGDSKPASADGQGPLTLALRVRRGQDAYLALNLCSRKRERTRRASPASHGWLSLAEPLLHATVLTPCVARRGVPHKGGLPPLCLRQNGRRRSGLTSWLRAWAF